MIFVQKGSYGGEHTHTRQSLDSTRAFSLIISWTQMIHRCPTYQRHFPPKLRFRDLRSPLQGNAGTFREGNSRFPIKVNKNEKQKADLENSGKFTLGISNEHFGIICFGGWAWCYVGHRGQMIKTTSKDCEHLKPLRERDPARILLILFLFLLFLHSVPFSSISCSPPSPPPPPLLLLFVPLLAATMKLVTQKTALFQRLRNISAHPRDKGNIKTSNQEILQDKHHKRGFSNCRGHIRYIATPYAPPRQQRRDLGYDVCTNTDLKIRWQQTNKVHRYEQMCTSRYVHIWSSCDISCLLHFARLLWFFCMSGACASLPISRNTKAISWKPCTEIAARGARMTKSLEKHQFLAFSRRRMGHGSIEHPSHNLWEIPKFVCHFLFLWSTCILRRSWHLPLPIHLILDSEVLLVCSHHASILACEASGLRCSSGPKYLHEVPLASELCVDATQPGNTCKRWNFKCENYKVQFVQKKPCVYKWKVSDCHGIELADLCTPVSFLSLTPGIAWVRQPDTWQWQHALTESLGFGQPSTTRQKGRWKAQKPKECTNGSHARWINVNRSSVESAPDICEISRP